ncbi:hypothetical protein C8Q74DRAFT_1445936 [Fomes fomentarius]|nr:hypothetical protein C8Q74DRAFT_1445936 [Fomes fomentarius]
MSTLPPPTITSKYTSLYPRRRRFSRQRLFYSVTGCVLMIGFVTWTLYYQGTAGESGSVHERDPDPAPVPVNQSAEEMTTKQPHPSTPHILPPLYSSYHEAELRLPQHHWNNTTPAEDEKFFYVAGHLHGIGWNNVLQELLFNAFLAHRSNRSFVMYNYSWNEDDTYSPYNGHLIPSKIPLSAIIRGPLVGGEWPAGDKSPLSVKVEYFNHICPRKVGLHFEDINGDQGRPTKAHEVTERWTKRLKSLDDPCVESVYEMMYVYNHQWIFGVRGSLDELWPEFSRSPILSSFAYSPLVELGFDTNRDLFLPSSLTPSPPYLSSLPPPPALTNAERYAPIPGLMVLHVRRGDYSYHCDFLAAAPEDFIVTNTLPGLPDVFSLPDAGIMDQFRIPTDWRRDRQNVLTPEAAAIFRRRCYPTVDEMARKVREVLDTPAARGVSRLYVMTNAKAEFVDEFRARLVEVKEDWEVIASSRDLALNWEQKYISQAIDAIAAQRAQVFIGNGFSTLTSNAVLFRMANGFPMDSIRFW